MSGDNNILVARHEDDDREVVVTRYPTKAESNRMDLWFALGRYLEEDKDKGEEALAEAKAAILALVELALTH